MNYYESQDLGAFGSIAEDAPESGKAFFEWYGTVFKDGELSKREKNLIALAVAHTKQCPYCIDAYTSACLESGSSPGEMMESVQVAAAISGGSTLVHAVQMRKQAEKMSM